MSDQRQKLVFTGQSAPSPALGRDREVPVFVRGEPGNIGYVAEDASRGSGVKVVELTD